MIQRLFSTQNPSNSHDNGTSTALSADHTHARDESLDTSQEDFEKARFDYCWLVYESEIKRQQQIETKIQFYLSLVTLFLGVVLFNLNAIGTMDTLLGSGGMPLIARHGVAALLVVLAASLIIALFHILRAYGLMSGVSFYPKNPHYKLFLPSEEGYLKQENTHSLYYENALSLAIAAAERAKTTEERTRWLLKVDKWIFSAVLSLISLIGLLTYYTLY